MLQAACPPDARQRSDRNGVAVPACHHDTRLLTRFAPDFVRSALAQNLPASLLQGRADLAVLLRHRPADARWQDGRAGRWPSPPRQARRWSWSWLPPGNEARWPRGHTPASPKSARHSEIIRGRTPSRATEPNRGPTRALNIRSHSSAVARVKRLRASASQVGQNSATVSEDSGARPAASATMPRVCSRALEVGLLAGGAGQTAADPAAADVAHRVRAAVGDVGEAVVVRPARQGDVVVAMDTMACETTLTPDGADAIADLLRRAAKRARTMPDRIRSAQVRQTGEERADG